MKPSIHVHEPRFLTIKNSRCVHVSYLSFNEPIGLEMLWFDLNCLNIDLKGYILVTSSLIVGKGDFN